MVFHTPLRYPGGKSGLAAWLAWTMRYNKISGGTYVEPYAGGAGAAMYLLCNEYVKNVIINDVDPVIYCFWWSILNDTERFLRKLEETPVTVDVWDEMKHVVKNKDQFDRTDIGFAGFFMNRTNRSGIMRGGIIGGRSQEAQYGITARYNKEGLRQRIERIARRRDRIALREEDGLVFTKNVVKSLPDKSLIYFDPPYFHKAERLYINYYETSDHSELSGVIKTLKKKWIVTYDDCPEIRKMYNGIPFDHFSVSYSAASNRPSSEEILFYRNIDLPRSPVVRRSPGPYPKKWEHEAAA